jgi:hypothetical protein
MRHGECLTDTAPAAHAALIAVNAAFASFKRNAAWFNLITGRRRRAS